MNKPLTSSSVKILKMQDLCLKIQSCRSAAYRRLDKNDSMYDPDFPKPIKLGSRAIGFIESEVDAWLLSRKRVFK
ncbi:MAG: AlpA family phage regulatory protein [Hydrogenophaga sp.]|nr:AlpA family phage regulatory protein [Hydrogenophaga sp.]